MATSPTPTASRWTPSPPVARSRVAASERAIGWVIPLALLAGAGAFFLVYLANGRIAELQSAAALAITALPFIVAAAEAPGQLLHPLAAFGFTMVLGVAGQTIYLTHGGALTPELLSGLSPEILNKGLLVVGIGVACLCAAYLFSRPVSDAQAPGRLMRWALRNRLEDPTPRLAFRLSLLLLAISVVAFAIYAPKVGIDSPAQLLISRKRFNLIEGKVQVYGPLRALIALCSVGFLLAVYTIVKNRIRWRSRLGAVAGLSIFCTAIFSVVASSRTELFATLAIVVFIAIALRRREPRPGLIAAIVIVALAGITVLAGARTAGQSSTYGAAGTGAVVENAVGSRDWMDIGPIATVVDRVPEAYPYQYGKTLASILWTPIPRSIWKSKPPVRIGPEIGPPVFGFPYWRVSGDPPGILGEFWINGGMIGVILGMAILGWLIKKVERWYVMVGSTDGLSALLYGIVGIAVCVQLPIADFTGVLITTIEYLVILGVLLWFARRRSAPAAPAIGPMEAR